MKKNPAKAKIHLYICEDVERGQTKDVRGSGAGTGYGVPGFGYFRTERSRGMAEQYEKVMEAHNVSNVSVHYQPIHHSPPGRLLGYGNKKGDP